MARSFGGLLDPSIKGLTSKTAPKTKTHSSKLWGKAAEDAHKRETPERAKRDRYNRNRRKARREEARRKRDSRAWSPRPELPLEVRETLARVAAGGRESATRARARAALALRSWLGWSWRTVERMEAADLERLPPMPGSVRQYVDAWLAHRKRWAAGGSRLLFTSLHASPMVSARLSVTCRKQLAA